MAVCTHTAKLRKTDGSHKSSFELISQIQLPKYSVRDRNKKIIIIQEHVCILCIEKQKINIDLMPKVCFNTPKGTPVPNLDSAPI